jgi:ABC-2 family transporter protein
MIWLTWRQFRAQAITAAIALAVMAIVLGATGPGLASSYASSGLPTCHASCATDATSFFIGLNRLDPLLYSGSILLMYLAPALMGIFWGAPLIARELETGTHRIAWNQSVTRTRWTFVKLGLVGLAAVATAGLLSLMVTWWASPIDRAASVGGQAVGFGLTRLAPAVFGARDVAPLGYAAFAFALGVTAGVLLRRTLPAMAVTLVVFAVIQVVVPNVVRPHLLPTAHATAPLNARDESFHLTDVVGSPVSGIKVTGQPFAKPGAWVLSDITITRSGAELTVAPKACQFKAAGPGSAPTLAVLASCRNALAAMHLRESVRYQPASRFWPLQGIETGIYLVLAAGLGWVCVSQVRRRRTP